MIAIDTNVLVRILTHDDPEQTARALALLEHDTVNLPVTVVLETEWVLRYCYGLSPEQIVAVFRSIVGTVGLVIDDHAAVVRAISLHAGGMDLADALHLSLANRQADRFCTFDQKLARNARRQSVPGVILL